MNRKSSGKSYFRIAIAAVLLIVLSATTALATADYFARYKYAFSPEALVAASAAVPPEQMDESALDIYRLGFAAGFDQALGNNAFTDGSGSSPFIAYPIDGGAQSVTRAYVGQPTTPPQTYIANKKSMAFHYPACSGAQAMKEENKIVFVGSREELISKGYHPCKNCNP